MNALTLSILENKNLSTLPDCVEGGALPALVSGLGPIHRAHLAAAMRQKTDRPLCVVVPDDTAAETMAADLGSFRAGYRPRCTAPPAGAPPGRAAPSEGPGRPL